MNNILLIISYDGTDFSGWQRQDKSAHGKPVRTVQGEIEKALEKLLKQPISLTGSGRTDAGVHAYGQVANFYSPIDSIPTDNYVMALNSMLPQDIRIRSAQKVEESFHSDLLALAGMAQNGDDPDTVPKINKADIVKYYEMIDQKNLENNSPSTGELIPAMDSIIRKYLYEENH